MVGGGQGAGAGAGAHRGSVASADMWAGTARWGLCAGGRGCAPAAGRAGGHPGVESTFAPPRPARPTLGSSWHRRHPVLAHMRPAAVLLSPPVSLPEGPGPRCRCSSTPRWLPRPPSQKKSDKAPKKEKKEKKKDKKSDKKDKGKADKGKPEPLPPCCTEVGQPAEFKAGDSAAATPKASGAAPAKAGKFARKAARLAAFPRLVLCSLALLTPKGTPGSLYRCGGST